MLSVIKGFKSIWDYFKNNILAVILFAVTPSVLMGLFFNPFKLITFMLNYSQMKVNSFGDIFNSQFGINEISLWGVGKVILMIIFTTLCLSVYYGYIENNMRSGKKDFKSIFNYINNNFLIIFINLVCVFILIFVINTILSGILFALHVGISGLNSFCTPVNFVVAVIICAIVFVLVIQILEVLLLNVPNMIMNGFTITTSISSTIRILDKYYTKLLLLTLLPFVVIIPLLFFASGVWFNIVVGCSTCVLISYYVIGGMIVYFKLSDTPRYDNRKYYINY